MLALPSASRDSRAVRFIGSAFVIAVCAPVHAASARDPERGLPLIEVIAPSRYDSPATPVGAQAFDLERLPDGALLVANNEGLLKLDGTGWRTWNPLRGAVLSVAADERGRVHLGGVGDFGWFDRFGESYVSLKAESERLGRPFGEVWAIVATRDAAYYVDRECVWRWDGRALALAYEGTGELRQSVALGDAALVLDPAVGLVLVDGATTRVLAGSEALAGTASAALAAHGGAAVTVSSDGVLRRYDAQGETTRVPLEPALAEALADARVSALAPLPDGGYAVGTRRRGLYLVGADGTLLGHLSEAAGFDDTRIFSLLALGVDGLWVGRDHGVALVEWPGQVSRYGTGLGLPRVPLGVARVAGVMNLVTTRGVYRLGANGTGFASAVPHALNDAVLFDFTASSETLYAAAREGLYALAGDAVERVDPRLSYVAYVLTDDPPRVLVGGDRSAWVVEHGEDGWRTLGDLPGVHVEIRRIVPESPNVVWLSSRSARQLLRVELGVVGDASWAPSDARVVDYSNNPAAPSAPVLPLVVGDGLVFANADGIHRHDRTSGRFTRDTALEARLAPSDGELRDSLPLGNDRVLFAQHDRYRVLRRAPDGWHDETTPLARIPRGATPRSLYREPDGTLWLSTSDAIYRHDPETQQALPSLPAPRVEQVDGSRARLLEGGGRHALGTGPRALTLRFSAPVFVASDVIEFRSRLAPLDRAWSAWSSTARRELAWVPGGTYHLEVEARDVFGRKSPVTRVELAVDWPWYQRPWALVVYAALALAAIAALIRLRERRLVARAAALEALVRERTQALEVASVTDQLTRLRNRHYVEAARRGFDPRDALIVMLLDLDHFKRVNDTRGHETGDRVLQAVATRLVDAAPRDAVLFRWGGEEFLLLVPQRNGDDAAALARNLLGAIGNRPVRLDDGTTIALTGSIGWDIAPGTDEIALRDGLRRADAHLYAAKRAGRDRAHGPGAATATRADTEIG